MKNSVLTEKIRWQVAHCERNIIDLDESDCSLNISSSDEDIDEHKIEHHKLEKQF